MPRVAKLSSISEAPRVVRSGVFRKSIASVEIHNGGKWAVALRFRQVTLNRFRLCFRRFATFARQALLELADVNGSTFEPDQFSRQDGDVGGKACNEHCYTETCFGSCNHFPSLRFPNGVSVAGSCPPIHTVSLRTARTLIAGVNERTPVLSFQGVDRKWSTHGQIDANGKETLTTRFDRPRQLARDQSNSVFRAQGRLDALEQPLP